MNCPVCDDVKMREVHKEDVLIDVCPSCKGVWLDRGELDKLMQGVREVRQDFNQWYDTYEPKPQVQAPIPPQPAQPYTQQQYVQPQSGSRPYYDKNYNHKYPHGKYKKKRSVMDLFEDLFD